MKHGLKLPDVARERLPVVLLSANGEVAWQAGELGVAACLPKPVTPDALLDVVERHFRKIGA